MTKLGLLGAAAVILSSALAGPVMAQQAIDNPGRCGSVHSSADCQKMTPGRYQRHATYRNRADTDRNDDRRADSGFWPGDVAAGVVGGAIGTADAAIGTAGAIATAPFRNDAYAYDNSGGYNNSWDNRSYAQRNGFVCQPGTWFKGEDGRRHICQ